jgi:tRNA threonylcarbamoyl adenosine modification protein (Sua5/YciO/YrdC/YwlC family)
VDKIISKLSIAKKLQFETKTFEILQHLREGKLIIAGLENGYILIGDPYSEKAIQKAQKLRNLDRNTYFPLLFTSTDSLQEYTRGLTNTARLLISYFTPGPINLVFKSAPGLPLTLGASRTPETLTVRSPKNRLIRSIIDLSGPLFFTPATAIGKVAPRNVDEISAKFISGVRHVVDTGNCETTLAATTVSFAEPNATVTREGVIPTYKIRKLVPEISGI